MFLLFSACDIIGDECFHPSKVSQANPASYGARVYRVHVKGLRMRLNLQMCNFLYQRELVMHKSVLKMSGN